MSKEIAKSCKINIEGKIIEFFPMSKDIPCSEGYMVSKNGLVWSLKNKIIMKTIINKGYKFLTLKYNGMQKSMPIHRILGLTFISNQNNKPQIDHINRDRADNRLENLRWVSIKENSRNLTKRKDTSSKYIGITWLRREKKWCVKIETNKKVHYLGTYDSEEDAHKARLKGEEKYWKNSLLLADEENSLKQSTRKNKSSKYVGVSLNKRDKKWRARIKIKGITYNLGNFDSEEDACKARLKSQENYRKKLPILDKETLQKQKSSKYIGVSWCQKSKKWRARIIIDGKDHFLGLYDTEEKAHLARLKSEENLKKSALPDEDFKKRKKSSKYIGVYHSQKTKKWYAYIYSGGKNHKLGTFNTEEDAHKARLKGEEKYRKG